MAEFNAEVKELKKENPDWDYKKIEQQAIKNADAQINRALSNYT
jgi:hypothetical protein